jgi:hypothetical protein
MYCSVTHTCLISLNYYLDIIYRQLLVYKRRMPVHELDERIDVSSLSAALIALIFSCRLQKQKNIFFDILKAVTANVIRNVGMKYIYDKCPAIAAVGKLTSNAQISYFVQFVVQKKNFVSLLNRSN